MTRLRSGLGATLFTSAQEAVLRLLYGHVEEACYLREIVMLTGLGVGHIQREVNRLAAAGILRRSERGRHVYFQADAACPIFEELRGIVRKTAGFGVILGEALWKSRGKIRVAFIYGSVARGEEKAESDIDLMVIGDAGFGEVVAAVPGPWRRSFGGR